MSTLKKLRENRKLTQEQVSNMLKITIQYVSMLENGERNPSDNIKEKLANLYKCDISDIFLAVKQTKRLKKQNKKGSEKDASQKINKKI